MKIHPTAIIEGDVSIGDGTEIGAFCYIRGPAIIGKNNRINPHCVIGTEPESRGAIPTGSIFIGENNIITEFTVIQRGTGDKETTVGNNNFFMHNTHIAHDCIVGDNVTIAPNVVLAGHTHIHNGATIGIGTSIHQFSTIGAYAMVGMNCTVTKDIPPFALVVGSPAVFKRYNTYQIKKLGIEDLLNSALYTEHYSRFILTSRREVLDVT